MHGRPLPPRKCGKTTILFPARRPSMPRQPTFPTYPRKPHASGQARISVQGTHVYLGAHGSHESRAKYAQLAAEWAAGGLPGLRAGPVSNRPVMTVLAAYVEHVSGLAKYHRDGRPTI